MRASRLAAELDQADEDCEVFINIAGHKVRIDQIEYQVGYVEIHLQEEHRTPCSYLEVVR